MTKIIRVLTLATVMIAAGSAAAHADPFTLGLVVAFASGAAGAAALGASTALALAVGAGFAALSYLSNSAAGKQKPGVTSYSKMQTGGVVPQSFIIGKWATAGSLVYFNYWGKDGKTPNAYESRVVLLSDLPSTELVGLTVDGTACTYGSTILDGDLGYPIPEYSKGGKDYLWVKFYDGTQTTADAFLVSKFGEDANRPYASTRVGKGRTYAIVTIRVNDQNLTSSTPIKFILKGAKWYDPRLDTTAGGDGSQRFDDPSTWAYSENPQIIRYNIRRGVYFGRTASASGQWMFGLQGMSAARLPYDNWVAAFNECDTEVTNNTGGTEAQFRCAGEISVDTEPATLDESLMRACNARHIEAGGIHLTITGAAGTSTKSYTDADFIITSPARYDPYPGLSGTVNAIAARFPDPSQNWEMQDAPPRYSSDLETEDGDRQLVAEVNYDSVPFAEQVQRNMIAALAEERRWRTHDLVWPHTEWENLPGDFISWTSDANGYDNKQFRIEKITILANRDIQATIREVDPSDYDYDPDSDFVAVPAGSLSLNPIPSQSIVDWDAEAVTIPGDNSRDRPGIKVTYSVTDIDDVDGILVEVRKASDASAVWSGESPHSVASFQQGEWILPTPFAPNTDYEVRGQYRPISARDVTWSAWLPVKTDDIRYGADDLYDEVISRAKLDAALKSFHDFIGPQVIDLKNKLRLLSQLQAESALIGASDTQTLQRQLVSVTGTVRAEFNEKIIAATGPDSTIVQDIATLTADLDGKADASALTALTTRVTDNEGDISANADALTALDTTVDRFSASGIFRVSVATTLSGADATAAIGVSVSDEGTTYTAGIYLNARTSDEKTEVLLVGSQIGLMDDDGTVFALFTDSGAYLNTAIIKNATIGTLHLENGAVTDPIPDISLDGTVSGFTGGNHDLPNFVTTAHTYAASGFVTIDFTGACAFTGSNYAGMRVVLVAIRSDGTQINGTVALYADNFHNGVGACFGRFFDTSPISDANVTYKIQVQTITSAPASTSLQVTGNLLTVQYKK